MYSILFYQWKDNLRHKRHLCKLKLKKEKTFTTKKIEENETNQYVCFHHTTKDIFPSILIPFFCIHDLDPRSVNRIGSSPQDISYFVID